MHCWQNADGSRCQEALYQLFTVWRNSSICHVKIVFLVVSLFILLFISMLGNFWSETLRLLSAESIHWVMIKLVWRIPAVLIQFRNTSTSCIHLSIQLSISTSHFCRCSWLDHDDRLISGGIPSLHMKCFLPYAVNTVPILTPTLLVFVY